MKIPVWGLYMMLTASIVGACLLAQNLNSQGWPSPFKR
jgi:hypothetical protein